MLPIAMLFPKWHDPEKIQFQLVHTKLDVIAFS
jgi:hypothetical protein